MIPESQVFDRTYHDTPYRVELLTESDRLTLTVESIDTGETWKGEFTSRFIEEITGKTGNAKKFTVFEKMLVRGLEGGSGTVVADLLSAEELEQLRCRKPGKSGAQLSTRVGNRRYLILTYCVEFDKVHYPLPLVPEETSDPQQLRTTIKRLREELKDLRGSLSKGDGGSQALIEENLRLRAKVREIEGGRDEVEAIKRENEDIREELRTYKGEAAATIRQLKNVNLRLQDELDHVRDEMDIVIQQIEEDQRLRAALPDAKTLLAMAKDYERLQQTVKTQKEALERYKEMLGEEGGAEGATKRSNSVPKHNTGKSALVGKADTRITKPQTKSSPRSPTSINLESSVSKLDRILKLMKS